MFPSPTGVCRLQAERVKRIGDYVFFVPYGGVQIARAAAERYKKSAVDAGYRTQNSGKVRISAYHCLCDENIVQKIVTSAVHAGCE